jgi:3-hydroxyacyl-CoA dehydrogenase
MSTYRAPLHFTDRSGGIRVLTLDNPPANAISFVLAAEIVAAIEAADADPAVRAVVVTGAGGKFSFGADIKDFATQPTPETKTVQDVMAAIERSRKTYAAAIEGDALGGGFELALTCDYRVGSKQTKLGFPEIKLGLFPGAGGTQRLPRLIGAADALKLMLKGDPITAQDALGRGILDEIADAGTVDAAIALIERVIAGAPKRRVSQRSIAASSTDDFDAAKARTTVAPEANGGLAAHKLIDAVAAAIGLPFAQGLAIEREGFDELLRSAQSAALQHVFFAERQLGKIPELPPAAAIDIASAGIIGAGTMGTGIAIAFASAGIPVVLIEPIAAAVSRSKTMVAGAFASQVKRGSLSSEQAVRFEEAISWASDLNGVAQADLVLEAVFESMDVKKDIFGKLRAICKPQAIFASNTSTLNIDEMAEASGRPQAFVGLHFFAPANIMKLLEIVRGTHTSAQTLTTAVKLGKTLRKVAVVSSNAFGFIGNRMFFDYTREALYLLEEGIAPERVDGVMKQFGFAMGPFATIDLSGVDVFWHIQQAQADALGKKRTNLMNRLYESKRWGQKTGVGFYKYDGVNKREPVPDPTLIELASEEAAKAGIAPRSVTDDEIRERLTYALVNAGAELLDKEIALRPGDEDIVYIYGYGFPRYHGGPMWYADEVGVAVVAARIKEFGWSVSPLLERIASSGGTIAGATTQLAHV